MKKILAVATALVLAISSLCVFAVADDTVLWTGTISSSGLTFDNAQYGWNCVVTYSSSDGGTDISADISGLKTALSTSGAVLQIVSTDGGVTGVVAQGNSGSGTASTTVVNNGDGTYTATVSADDIVAAYSSFLNDGYKLYVINYSGVTITVTSISVIVPDTSSSSSSTVLHTATQSDTSAYELVYSDYLSSYSTGDSVTITVNLETDAPTYSNGCVGASDYNSSWTQVSYGTSNSNYTYDIGWTQSGSVYTATVEVTVAVNSTSAYVYFWWVESSYINVTSVTMVNNTTSQQQTTTTTTRFIYVNEDYHALIINGHFICIPHTVNANGVCTVCKEYVGGEETESSTTTIDGVEYDVAYTVDVSLGSSNGWGQLDLGDTALIDALSQEGALLVITRDGVSDTVHNGSETYEKFGLVNSWWSGTWIALGTAGHTSATEEGTIDCISDDGTTVIYDGATVYAEWVSRGMTAGGTVELISNTSNSLKITNVTVYVPAGTVVTETVEVAEPVEDTNTETEDDELDVDDNDAEEVTETNPTTGAVLALVPMAIAGFAVVASKRK